METTIESKIGQINAPAERVFNFLSNFNNFKHFIPPDKVKDWESTPDSCSFSVEGLGKTGLRIIEKTPFSTIKITGAEGSPMSFYFWMQLKEANENDTRVKLTIKADLNPFLKMMATKPLQNFVDTLVEQLGKIPF
jgi:carbon monoxide dehydrogenase subunit G